MGLENVENARGPEQGVMVSRDVRWKLLFFRGVGEPLKSFKQGGEEVLVRPIASHLVPSDDPPASICQHRIGPPSHREAEVTCRLGCDCVCVSSEGRRQCYQAQATLDAALQVRPSPPSFQFSLSIGLYHQRSQLVNCWRFLNGRRVSSGTPHG